MIANKKWLKSSRGWVLIPNENTDENHTCFGSHIKTTRGFHLSSNWTSRFMAQNKANWTQKQYFSLINHRTYHLHCQFIFFSLTKIFTSKFVNEKKLKIIGPSFFNRPFGSVGSWLRNALLQQLWFFLPSFWRGKTAFVIRCKRLPSSVPHDLQRTTTKFPHFDYF